MTFADWYIAYPRKRARFDAEKAYCQQIKQGYPESALLTGAKAFRAMCYALKTKAEFVPYPATWLRAGSWMDEELLAYVEKPKSEIAVHASWNGSRAILEKALKPGEFEAWFAAQQYKDGVICCQTPFIAHEIDRKFKFVWQRVFGTDIRALYAPGMEQAESPNPAPEEVYNDHQGNEQADQIDDRIEGLAEAKERQNGSEDGEHNRQHDQADKQRDQQAHETLPLFAKR